MADAPKANHKNTTGPGSHHVAVTWLAVEADGSSTRQPRDGHATSLSTHGHSALSIRSERTCNCQSNAHHGRPAHSTPRPQVRPRAVGARRPKVPQGTQLQRRRVPRRWLQRLPQRFRQSTSHCIRLSPLKKLVSHHSRVSRRPPSATYVPPSSLQAQVQSQDKRCDKSVGCLVSMGVRLARRAKSDKDLENGKWGRL